MQRADRPIKPFVIGWLAKPPATRGKSKHRPTHRNGAKRWRNSAMPKANDCIGLRIPFFDIADDGLPTVIHMDVLDADKLLSTIAKPSEYLDLSRVSPH
jgi:hypothetical protein